MSKSKRAVLLLGHGSKAGEANEILKKIADSIGASGGYGAVGHAFLQIAKPDFGEGLAAIAEKGFRDVTVMPYFLYTGLHVKEDIPGLIEAAKEKYADVKITLAGPLCFDQSLVDLTIKRIEEAAGIKPQAPGPFEQHPIERESFRIIEEEMDCSRFSALELPIVKRVIHTTADFSFQDLLRFSPGAIEAGIEAIRAGKDVITDVKMVQSGITKSRLPGSPVRCFSSDEDVETEALRTKSTKTAAAMRKAAKYFGGGIVVIGNAPTALMELLKLVKEGVMRPALVIGVPVGFVGAAESKEALMRSGLNHITITGRKGGSTVAAAIANAIAIEAAQVAVE